MIETEQNLSGSIASSSTLSGKVASGVVMGEETDPTVPSYIKEITEEDIRKWNQSSDLNDYATKQYVDEAINNKVANVLGGDY